ncbi:serine hydrolase, partial [Streptomyces sp. NPDC057757]
WSISLAEGVDRLYLCFDGSGWTTASAPVPTAVSGGWTAPDTLRVDVIFLETPHRLTVTCSLSDRTLTADWHTRPLRPGRLRFLRAPRDGDAVRRG